MYNWKMWNHYDIYDNCVYRNVSYDVHCFVNIAKVNPKLVCRYCVINFLENNPSIGHIRIHTGEKTCKCILCDANIKPTCDLKYKTGS